MALTRKMLKVMGIEEEQIDQIIEAHTESTDALKEERDKYKEEADKVLGLQNTIDSLQKEVETLQKAVDEDDSYKEKYENEVKAFTEYKKDIETKEVKATKLSAYKALLKKAGVSDKRIESILKVTPIEDIEVDVDGQISDPEKVIAKIKEDWSEFIVKESTKGAETENPPSNTGGKQKMTKEEIMAIKDRNKRQEAISENHELFGY